MTSWTQRHGGKRVTTSDDGAIQGHTGGFVNVAARQSRDPSEREPVPDFVNPLIPSCLRGHARCSGRRRCGRRKPTQSAVVGQCA